MNDTAPPRKGAATPAKLLLIGILALILLYLVFGGDTPKAARLTDDTAWKPAEEAPPAKNKRPPAPTPKQWPQFDYNSVISHNPFIRPEDLLTQQRQDPQTTQSPPQYGAQLLRELSSERVDLVLQDEDGAAAIWGSRVVRKGDVVDGFRIVDIRADGIIVERAN